MCGFFGVFYLDRNQSVDRSRLAQSMASLDHRGPDGTGIYEGGGIGLVHTRLSMVDLNERSNQPFWDATQRYVIVYNGEIYNHQQLRQEQEALGVVFRTTSDTEVVLYTLLHFGVESGIRKLEGMFSLALYDSKTHNLTIARDRLGIKPLYVVCRDREVYFASEIKALLPWQQVEPNLPCIIGYLTSGELSAAGPTFFKDVESLPPGSIMTLDSDGIHRVACLSRADYWDPERADQLAAMSDRRLIDEFDRVFEHSVLSQLVADAPVGALCSGGVDSSLVLSVAARHHRDLAIFHADVVGRESEYEYALALARHLKLDLLKVDVIDNDFIDRMPDIIEHREHPYTIQHNSIAFLKVSELVNSTGTKAVLTGEGSDEAFLGYGLMMLDLVKVFKRNVAMPFAISGKVWRKMTGRQNSVEQSGNWIKHFGMALAGYQRHSDMPAILEQIRSQHGDVLGSKDLISFEWLGYHLRHLLMRNDTLGMASGIESRFPFLNTEVLKLAVNLPYNRRVRKSLTLRDPEHLFQIDKWPVRALADRYLPKSLARRPKWPFRTSAQDRMQVPWTLFKDSWLTDSLAMPNRHVEMLFSNIAPNIKSRMLHTYVWGELFLQGTPKSQVVDRLNRHIRF
jgi:asparagine synthase (glutamine-hydrolysing)